MKIRTGYKYIGRRFWVDRHERSISKGLDFLYEPVKSGAMYLYTKHGKRKMIEKPVD